MNAEDLLQAFDEVLSEGVRRGAMQNVVTDDWLDGRLITVRGRRLVNFGSCSYLGLETHPALRAGVVDAVTRYGTQFSSSRTYLSVALYELAERALGDLFGRETIITPSTTLGHQATVPTLIGPRDVLLMDHQLHSSAQTAAKLARVQGTTVELIPHNDLGTLERRIRQYRRDHRRIWYAADGLYSMYADFAPVRDLVELVDRYEQLWLYIDDAHGFSWTGRHGRGYALEHLSADATRRSVVVGSLNKSFAAAGGAVTVADAETRRRVFTVGGPLIFSGPVQPPMLGAVLASARLHRCGEVEDRQRQLRGLIRRFNRLAAEQGLPLVSTSEAPIRCVGAGTPETAYHLCNLLRDRGYFVDTATYPAVPAKRSGVRITLTAHHREEDVDALVDALADALPAALASTGSSPQALRRAFGRLLPGWSPSAVAGTPPTGAPETHGSGGSGGALRLEHHRSIDTIDPTEWDGVFAGRGAFDHRALRLLETVFAADPGPDAYDGTPAGTDGPAGAEGGAGADGPEDRWGFHYWIVRDAGRAGRIVAATFFTTALWKSDLLAPAAVSARVERQRRQDPYHLTATVVGMGSLLTEGDHLFLDRTADWRGALRLVLAAARSEEDRAKAAAVVLRDLPGPDRELHRFLLGQGFARTPALPSWVREVDFADEREFLAGLPKKHRYHQRTRVLGREPEFVVRVYPGGAAAGAVPVAQRDHLYRLYRNVHARKFEINVFPLPRVLIDAVLTHPGWELVTLAVAEAPGDVVAFAVHHVGAAHLQPLLVGLDYRYVASHDAYQQVLWQTFRSARRHRIPRVLLGMSADLQKSRFGAASERRSVYTQLTEGFQADVLSHLAEQVESA